MRSFLVIALCLASCLADNEGNKIKRRRSASVKPTNTGCVGQYSSNYEMSSNSHSTYYDHEAREKCDHIFGFTGPTANDQPENLLRPCAFDNWQCIREYFAANSNCKPAYGPVSDPLILDVNTVIHPIINITIALPNLHVKGLSNAMVRDFYVNKVSGNLVFAIDVPSINETVARAYFRYRRTAKESIVLADFAKILLQTVTLTAVIPKVPNLRLDLADIHPFLQEPPIFIPGPGIYTSPDPDVIAEFNQLSQILPWSIREYASFQSVIFTSLFIQQYICDFGLQIISV